MNTHTDKENQHEKKLSGSDKQSSGREITHTSSTCNGSSPIQRMLDESPQVKKGARLQAMMDQSPLIKSQERVLKHNFGGAVQRQKNWDLEEQQVQHPEKKTLPASNAPIQRKIRYGKEEDDVLPNTWLQFQKAGLDKKIVDQVTKIMQAVRKELGPLDENQEKKLMGAWVKVNKSADEYQVSDTEAIKNAVIEKYHASINAQNGYRARNKETKEIAKGLLDEDKEMEFQPSARNPMVKKRKMEKFDYDSDTPKEEQFQKHVSTVVLNTMGEGEEAQASLSNDNNSIFVSTNSNKVNDHVRKKLKTTGDIKGMAADLLKERNLENLSKEAAMKDHVVRHALKLFARIEKFLLQDAVIKVPQNLETKFDGRHAEIRIEQSEGWDEDDYHHPTGTKYPCMGCMLYFDDQGHDIGVRMGPLWVTNAAISTQMESQLDDGKKIGGLNDQTEEVAKVLSDQFKHLSKKVKMGMGKHKDGTYDIDRQADSDSEMEDDDFKKVKEQVKNYK